MPYSIPIPSNVKICPSKIKMVKHYIKMFGKCQTVICPAVTISVVYHFSGKLLPIDLSRFTSWTHFNFLMFSCVFVGSYSCVFRLA